MDTAAGLSVRFERSFKHFARYLVGLHKLTTFDAVSKAEGDAHERIGIGFEEMAEGEKQAVMLMQQFTELYARDRQLQITGRNPYEMLIEMDQAEMKKDYSA